MGNYQHYETALAEARENFRVNAFNQLVTEKDPQKLMSFWLNFCSKGVGMTEPVESWIKRAGEKCIELGFTDLGADLKRHATHEADHHLLMIDDTRNLAKRWNQFYSPTLTSENLISSSFPDSVKDYRQLHENCIASNSPYGQIAIEYEIENLTATYGTQVIQHTANILGENIIECLSFLVDHARLDIGHTEFNRKVLTKFVDANPHTLPELIHYGIQAVEIYCDVINDYLSIPIFNYTGREKTAENHQTA